MEILDWVARGNLAENVTFEQKSEGSKGMQIPEGRAYQEEVAARAKVQVWKLGRGQTI